MKKLLLIPLIIFSCSSKDANEKAKLEVMQVERDFSQAAKEKGIASAFYTYADNDAVIKRGKDIIKGREAIQEFYEKQSGSAELQWSPDFADVSGDLGYTYGKFTFSEKDSTGKVNEVKGIFHTVWKRQKDGSWKFVFD